MPLIVCPCCRASNEVGPHCRRCKCDLSLLFAAETRRAALLQQASRELSTVGAPTALLTLKEAEMLRPGPDIHRLRAVAYFLSRDYPLALTCYTAAKTMTESAARA